jgi:hypothetical protein
MKVTLLFLLFLQIILVSIYLKIIWDDLSKQKAKDGLPWFLKKRKDKDGLPWFLKKRF